VHFLARVEVTVSLEALNSTDKCTGDRWAPHAPQSVSLYTLTKCIQN